MSLQSRGFPARYVAVDHQARENAKNARMRALLEQVRLAPKPSIVMGGTTTAPSPKAGILESVAYERAAKALGYCMRCGLQVQPLTGLLDFCHADEGKGQGIKTDVRRGWPGCRDCHEHVSRKLAKPVRRAVEFLLAVMTRAAVIAAGTWPARLAKWKAA